MRERGERESASGRPQPPTRVIFVKIGIVERAAEGIRVGSSSRSVIAVHVQLVHLEDRAGGADDPHRRPPLARTIQRELDRAAAAAAAAVVIDDVRRLVVGHD